MEFKNKLFLAPMDGVTNKEFRDECISAGADVVCTPLISAKDIIANKEKAINEINSIKGQHACGVQIFFCSANEAVLAIKQILNIFHPDYIDLNMCCPSPRVCKTGAGCSWMRDPKGIAKVIKAAVSASSVPVTIKIRSGWNAGRVNAVEISKIAQDSGVSAIFIHPRTKDQGYEGKADWDVIKKIKESVHIPVIGNGDITNYEDYKRMKEVTGCDSVMIGRATIKNKNIFSDIKKNY